MRRKGANRLLDVLGVALLVLALAVAACGADVTPTKVGEVDGQSATPQAETGAGATAEGSPATVTEGQAEPGETETASPTGVAPERYAVGDVISIGDMVLVVLGWETPAGDDFAKPEAGEKFVAVDLLLVNKGDSATSVSSLLQMSLKDEASRKYSVDLMAAVAAGGGSPDGEISAGERLRGKVGFAVPEGAGELTFVFDASVFGKGKVFVDLGDQPVSLEPPAELAGESPQELYRVGDVISMGDISLTVNGFDFPAGDSFSKPDAGRRFVAVDLTVENHGAKAANISTLLQMSLKDDTGQKYGVDFMATAAAGGATLDGEIAPGEKVRGQVGYEVPESAEGLVFVFDADVFGHGKVFVALR